jgi:hypothetical protein
MQTPTSPPINNGPCSNIGERVTNSSGVLECRYIKGKILIWVQLSFTPPAFQNPKSAQDVSMCKLKGSYAGNAIRGFVPDVSLMGMGNVYPRINPAVGINDAVIVPIDFPDFVGDKDLDAMIKPNKDNFLAWVDYFSSGKLKTNLDSYNKWIRMPQQTDFYKLPNFEGENDLRSGQEGNRKLGQLFVDEISKHVDLTKYRTMYLLFPRNPQEGVLAIDLPPRMVEFKVQGAPRVMSLFAGIGWGYDNYLATPPWAMWVHEITHDWGLDGHAPGNGWNVGITSNQAGISLSLNAWERFLLTWMPDSLVFCETKETIKTETIRLSALERDDQQTKMIAIALDADRLLVIEAHGIGKWYSQRPEQNAVFKFPFKDTGLYHVLAYIVNTKYVYPEKTIVQSNGGALSIDDGVNPNIPRQAYFVMVDGGVGSHDYRLTSSSNPKIDYAAYAAVQGDSFTIEGIKIKFIATGDYETIEISKG